MTVVPKVRGYRLLVKPMEVAETIRNGVVLPAEAKKREARGVVVAVGGLPGVESSEDSWVRESPAEVGDVVVWDDNQSTYRIRPPRVELDLSESGVAEEFVVLEWGDVLLVLEDAPSHRDDSPSDSSGTVLT